MKASKKSEERKASEGRVLAGHGACAGRGVLRVGGGEGGKENIYAREKKEEVGMGGGG